MKNIFLSAMILFIVGACAHNPPSTSRDREPAGVGSVGSVGNIKGKILGNCKQDDGDVWLEAFVIEQRDANPAFVVVKHLDDGTQEIVAREVIENVPFQQHTGNRHYESAYIGLTIEWKHGALMGDLQSKAYGFNQSNMLCK